MFHREEEGNISMDGWNSRPILSNTLQVIQWMKFSGSINFGPGRIRPKLVTFWKPNVKGRFQKILTYTIRLRTTN